MNFLKVFSTTILFFFQGKKRSYIINKSVEPYTTLPKVLACGIALSRTHDKFAKISTASAQAFGSLAKKNKVMLSADQLDDYLNRQIIQVEDDQLIHVEPNRYVLVCYEDHCLGTGYIGTLDKPTLMKSLFPKAWKR